MVRFNPSFLWNTPEYQKVGNGEIFVLFLWKDESVQSQTNHSLLYELNPQFSKLQTKIRETANVIVQDLNNK